MTDRLIVEFRNENRTPMYEYDIHQMLYTIGGKIANGYSGGIENTNTHEVQWTHESEMYGGFRKGVVKEETMKDIHDLLRDYEACEDMDCDNSVAFREDAIALLSRIMEENEQ